MAETISDERRAALDELGTLHDIHAIINEVRVPAGAWAKAKSMLDYLGSRIDEVQARADALNPEKEP